MIKALMVGLITVIALAAALLASENRNVPPLAPKAERADLIMIDKSERCLMLYQEDEIIFQTKIALGSDPIGDKRAEGDGRTPEGEFRVSQRNDESKYYLSLGLPYPGGIAVIHGQPNLAPGALTIPGDWTDGDIAVSNAAMRMIWRKVNVGTKILVRP